jgi:predicted nuclease with TOPRIM domain
VDIDSLQHQLNEVQSENDNLLSTKESLLSEIDDLESSLRRSKHEFSRYNRNMDYNIDLPSRYEDNLGG